MKLSTLSLLDVDAIAAEALDDVTDKAGRPLIEHSRAVSNAVAGFGTSAQMAALLHDVVEDTPVTLEDLVHAGVPWIVVNAVDILTYNRELFPSRAAYINQVRRSFLPLIIKVADNAHNSHEDRLGELDPLTAERLRKKYANERGALWERLAVDDLQAVLVRINPELCLDLTSLV